MVNINHNLTQLNSQNTINHKSAITFPYLTCTRGEDNVACIFDANGNLLNDGVNTYAGVYPEPAEGIPRTDWIQ
jgi:hypothetical protein